MKKLFFLIFVTTLLFSCRKNSVLTPNTPAGANDAAQVTASVSGIVTNENNIPIEGATVKSGAATTTTNVYGVFNFTNISISQNNGAVTVTKNGYFKGTRTFKTTANKQHQLKIQLMQKTLSGTINAVGGGTITANGGATIVFPANAIVTSTGAAYTGTVNVYSRWIDPTAANLPSIIPGDLRGLNTGGTEKLLETYGMIGAELEDVSGNPLKIATGKTATITGAIPASLQASAPATISLWHFDETTARWKEEGTATKTGTTYVAQVNKFSFWNYDVPSDFIILDYTLINSTTGTPLGSTQTRIKRISNGTYGYGYTNGIGFISGAVPKNEALVLEVYSPTCGVLYTQNIGPFSSNTNLGNINVAVPVAQTATISGFLKNCTGNPVTNGTVSLYITGGTSSTISVNATTGAFSFTTLKCGTAPINYAIVGTDNATSQQGLVTTGSNSSNNFTVGNITACGTSIGEYVNLVIDGVPINFNSPVDTFATDQQVYGQNGFAYEMELAAAKNLGLSNQQSVLFDIYNNNNASTGVLSLFVYEPVLNGPQDMFVGNVVTAVPVNFTTFGSIPGTYVSGSFSCVTGGSGIAGIPKNVTCSFKLKRTN